MVDGDLRGQHAGQQGRRGDLRRRRPGGGARAIQILTPTKGWAGSVYVAKKGPAPPSIDGGWQKLGDIQSAKASQRVDLDTAGNRFRYYLVWITELPPGADQVQISEIRLFK